MRDVRSSAILFDAVSFSGVGIVSGTYSDNLSVPQQRVVENDEIFISVNKFNRIFVFEIWYILVRKICTSFVLRKSSNLGLILFVNK